MTAPAPIPLSRTEVRAPARDTAPAASNADTDRGQSSDFAAFLAQDARPAGQSAPAATTKPEPLRTGAEAPVDQAAAAEEPGKTLPVIRQSLAAPVAALRLLIAAGAKDDTADTTADTAVAASDQTEADRSAETASPLPALLAALPVAGQAPTAGLQASAATSQPPRTASTRQVASPATPTAPRADEATQTAAPVNAPQPAAFAAAQLVFERDTVAAPAEPAAPPPETASKTPAAAQDIAARAQPSTLAALTGTSERPATRKLRGESEAALPAAKPALLPDTAGALALAQPGSAPAAAPLQTPATPTPQPLSFDQLVDSIARARDGADQGGPVAVALHHGEFGRISLRIESDATGLSVAMASPDPAFAPAVAAAHAAAVAEPARSTATGQHPGSREQGLAQGQSGSNSDPGSSQQRQPPAIRQPAANPAGSPVPRTERGGGIFA
ncbi:hypothetical protein [Novosphingobium sp. NDB2Meth1]|uniref:hypothetical protein n=1 Tax=Novosphingobium sp. NDB2Meth1 TaxID=1892847 RepID=UPI000A99A3B6|nr:hypothetical protein [Novosphingobium sp. NDB2Meth1]